MNQYPDYTSYQINANPTPPPADLSRARKHVGISAFAVAFMFVLTSVAQIFGHALVTLFCPALVENDWYLWAMSGFPMYFFAMPVCYLIMRLVPTQKPQKQKQHPLMWVGFLCLCFAVTVLANLGGQYFNSLFYYLTGIEIENQLQEMTVNTPFIINLIFVGILAPIFEELFYRKAVIDRLRRYGDLPAILISGLAFGLVHGNFNQVFYTVAVGILLSFIYVYTGNVIYTISIHAAFNLIGGVYTSEVIRRVGEELIPADGDVIGMLMVAAYSLFILASLVAGIVFFAINAARFFRSVKKGEETLTLGEWLKVVFVNPGVWVFVIIVALLFVSSLLG